MNVRTINITVVLLLIWGSLLSQSGMTLAEAKSLTLQNNISIKNSQLEIDAAEALYADAQRHYKPQVSANAALMYALDPLMEITNEGGDLPVYDGDPANLANATQYAYIPPSTTGLLQRLGVVNVGISQPLYTGGKINTGHDLTALGVDIRAEQKRMTEKDLLLNVTQQYWQIISLQEKQAPIDGYRELLDRLHLQVTDAYEAGLIIRNDVYKVELEQSQLNINESRLHNGKELAKRQFSNTLGISYDSSLYLIADIDDYHDPAYYAQLDRSYMEGLSEVQLLQKAIRVEELKTQLEEAEHKPTVAVGANAYYMTQFQEQSSAANMMGFVTVGMPLNHLWQDQHKVQEQRIRADIARNNLEQTRDLLDLRTAKAQADLYEAYEQIGFMTERVDQAAENYKVNEASYESGVIPLSDLLEAKALHTEAQDGLIDAKINYQKAIATYLQYTGR